MEKNIFLIIVVSLLYACSSSSDKKDEGQLAVQEKNTVEEFGDFDILEEEELDAYQRAVKQYEKSDVFPKEVILENKGDLKMKESLRFDAILKMSTNWFLCSYFFEEGEIEDTYYFTFDYSGKQLDVKRVKAIAEDREGHVLFSTDSTFVVNQTINKVKLDDNDELIVLSSKKTITNYGITNAGGFFEELTNYQKARENHLQKEILPQAIVLKSKDVDRLEDVNFYSIIKTFQNFFVLEYQTFATEVENTFYLTFDYDGNQLDAHLVNTIAIDLDGEIVFTSGSTFQVNQTIKNIEWDEADVVEVGEPKMDTIYYLLTTKGNILLLLNDTL